MTTGQEIPLVDLGWQRDQIAEEVRAGWDEILSRTAFVGGEVVAAFEQEMAEASGAAHCIGVANGTDALEIALRALDLGPGDVVALPANTFIATAFAVLRCGATPRLVDVRDDTLLIDSERLDLAGCRALMPVHLFGQIAPMEQLTEIAGDIPVLEDAAQAQGATRHGTGIGGHGRTAGTSFYPGKNLGAYGDAGAVLCNDDALAERIRRIANHGSASKYDHVEFGFNSRLDPLQAVVLRAKLARLEAWNELRRHAAATYAEMLADVDEVRLPVTDEGNLHVWHIFAVRVPGRDGVLRTMQEAGIGAGVHYPVPVHFQPAMRSLGYSVGDFPVAEAAASSMISLPLYPGISESAQERVVETLRKALA